jgi:hypothetical protein
MDQKIGQYQRKAQGARRKAQGARRKAQGARRKAQGLGSDFGPGDEHGCDLGEYYMSEIASLFSVLSR